MANKTIPQERKVQTVDHSARMTQKTSPIIVKMDSKITDFQQAREMLLAIMVMKYTILIQTVTMII